MKRTIGFRCTPQIIYYCIIQQNDDSLEIIDVNKIIVPKSMIEPEQLKYIRNTILDIINEYEIYNAGIRITESNSQTLSINRIHLEGVILELFASSCLNCYYIGQISNISKFINIPREDFKHIISGSKEYKQIDGFEKYSNEEKESILTAIGAFSC
jgi:hypothetical protein